MNGSFRSQILTLVRPCYAATLALVKHERILPNKKNYISTKNYLKSAFVNKFVHEKESIMKKLLIISAVALSALLFGGVTEAGESAQNQTVMEETGGQSTPEPDPSYIINCGGQDICAENCNASGCTYFCCVYG
jgi:hypothetical protein